MNCRWLPRSPKKRSRFGAREARRAKGLSLLEVIIATAVLAASAAVIAQMVGVAVQHASRVTELTEAHTLCHNLMNEFVAGIRPWENVTAAQSVDPWTPWEYEVKIEPLGFANLSALTVTVMQRPTSMDGGDGASPLAPPPSDSASTRSEANGAGGQTLTGTDGRRRYRWTRWVRQEVPEDERLVATEPTERQRAEARP